MKMRIIELFTFGNGDDKYVIISEYNGNDIWLLDEFCPNNNWTSYYKIIENNNNFLKFKVKGTLSFIEVFGKGTTFNHYLWLNGY